jgi:hypothetical protein
MHVPTGLVHGGPLLGIIPSVTTQSHPTKVLYRYFYPFSVVSKMQPKATSPANIKSVCVWEGLYPKSSVRVIFATSLVVGVVQPYVYS